MNQKYEQLQNKFDESNVSFHKEINQKEEEKTDLQNQHIVLKNKYDELQLKFNKFNQSNDVFFIGINSYFNIPSNIKEAFHYFEISSKDGNCYASYLAGVFFNNGIGVEKNSEKAICFYKKSCEQGNSYGYNKLGLIYFKGEGVEKNLSKAIEYYEKSSELGNSDAKLKLEKLRPNAS